MGFKYQPSTYRKRDFGNIFIQKSNQSQSSKKDVFLIKISNKLNIKAIFKPFDEEPYADNNPKGYPGKLGSPGFRSGIRSGESAAREVATYLLDLKGGFHGVPETVYAEVKHHYFNKSSLK